MKTNLSVFTIILITTLTTCQPAPPPITVAQDVEFSLAEDQTATITDTGGLTIRLIGVAGDERCPSEIECAMSGPVSISHRFNKTMEAQPT